MLVLDSYIIGKFDEAGKKKRGGGRGWGGGGVRKWEGGGHVILLYPG